MGVATGRATGRYVPSLKCGRRMNEVWMDDVAEVLFQK